MGLLKRLNNVMIRIRIKETAVQMTVWLSLDLIAFQVLQFVFQFVGMDSEWDLSNVMMQMFC